MKKKLNNKGFSLVELIVVMAIMAILAVTLAPKLTHYVEKARKASDQEVVSSIYTAAQYGLMDSKINTDAVSLGIAAGIHLNLNSAADADTEVFEVTGKEWKPNNPGTAASAAYTGANNKFIKEIYSVVENFKFKSDAAGENTDIVITVSGGALIVDLQYTRGTSDYTLDSSVVR